jgi:RecA-family ATPase
VNDSYHFGTLPDLERGNGLTAATRDMMRDIDQRWRMLLPEEWQGVPVPPREWIVPDFIPAKTVTLLAGEGAAGKSTLALQLAAARALAREWLSTIPKPGRTLVLSAEDDAEELHRRLDAIRAYYGASFDDLADLRLVDLVGADAVLGALAKSGKVEPTGVFEMMMQTVEHHRPDLVIIDALADAFAGDENNRGQARQFIGLLKRPARQLHCAFLCLAHPSLTGLATGTGSSGSTAWANSVRSRIFFEKAKASDGSEPDPDMRTITVNKANYARAGLTLTVKWQAGVYVAQAGANSLDRRALENRADATFLELLALFNTRGQDVSHKPGPTYAPNRFAEHPDASGIGKKHFATAMQRLIANDKVKIEVTGPRSRQRSRLVISGGD